MQGVIHINRLPNKAETLTHWVWGSRENFKKIQMKDWHAHPCHDFPPWWHPVFIHLLFCVPVIANMLHLLFSRCMRPMCFNIFAFTQFMRCWALLPERCSHDCTCLCQRVDASGLRENCFCFFFIIFHLFCCFVFHFLLFYFAAPALWTLVGVVGADWRQSGNRLSNDDVFFFIFLFGMTVLTDDQADKIG